MFKMSKLQEKHFPCGVILPAFEEYVVLAVPLHWIRLVVFVNNMAGGEEGEAGLHTLANASDYPSEKRDSAYLP